MGSGGLAAATQRMRYTDRVMEDLQLLWIPVGTFAILGAVMLMFFVF